MSYQLKRSGARALLWVSGIALMAAAAPAAAQQAPEANGQTTTVDEIVVTARRRDERLQDVPVAVTALSSATLETLQATDIGDLQGAVPNLSLHVGDASNAVVYIRGVGQVDSLAFADPGVGIYIDDVYLGRAQGAFLSVYDVDRIEVLRGPQGTLYGRNTIGGAVKFVSTPLSAEPGGRVELSVGDYGLRAFRGALGGALAGDNLLAKAAVSLTQRDGYAHNAFDGRSDGDQDQIAGRLAFEYRPSDDVSLRLNIDASRDRPDTSRTPARATSVFGLYPATTTDPFQVDADYNDLANLDTFGVSLTGEWVLSDTLTAKSITAYRTMDYITHLDLDATPMPFFGIYDDEQQSQFSQELQLTYAGERWNVVGGLFYFDETDSTFAGLFGPAISVITAELNDYHNRSWAAYGQGSYELGERLNLTAGLRYTYEQKDFVRTQDLILGGTTTPRRGDTGFRLASIDTSSDWSSLTPKIGLDYRVSDDVLAYVSISQGFKSGGFDGRAGDATGATPYEPETLWAYEAGLKSTLFDHRLIANLAMFWNDYTDLQLSSFTADSGGGFRALFTNAGAATIRGVELELMARPTAALNLTAVVSYLDGEYDEYIGPGGLDISNQRTLVNAPEWSGRLGGVYTVDMGPGGMFKFGADASYRSKTYPTVSSSEVVAQGAFTLVDAFARWEASSGRYFAELGGKNLTDERYIEHAFDLSASPGYQLAYYGAPRTVRFTVGARF
ncbi:TonB-dependent receptor [uncultured Brevundimonas sp.]|uniref:TonB-dependent receptor n=1 Tax=uncultured Brevundimonas sp. TaxID=213418 RepID=UPI0030EBE814|tara:strand:- start:1811 stop:4000 length:2190 start_codon:yes stop_codon:yes gene_type:complete